MVQLYMVTKSGEIKSYMAPKCADEYVEFWETFEGSSEAFGHGFPEIEKAKEWRFRLMGIR